MEQNPSWEANSFSTSQEIPHISWNPTVHHSIHKLPLPVPTLSQFNPVYNTPPNFLKIHFNITLLPTPKSYKCSLAFRSSHQNSVCISYVFHTCHESRPSHCFFYMNHLKQIWWGVQIMKLLTSFLDCLCCRSTKCSLKFRGLVKCFLTV